MSEILTKSRARNIFYGGSLFFVVVFIGLVGHRPGRIGAPEVAHIARP